MSDTAITTPSDNSATRQHVPIAAALINVVAVVIAIVLVILVLADVHNNIRLWLTLALFIIGPGSGITQFLRLPDVAMQIGVLVGLSAGIDIMVGQSLLWAHNLSGQAAVCVLAGFTLIRPIPLGRPSQPTNATPATTQGNQS
jgi:hypothetical protein